MRSWFESMFIPVIRTTSEITTIIKWNKAENMTQNNSAVSNIIYLLSHIVLTLKVHEFCVYSFTHLASIRTVTISCGRHVHICLMLSKCSSCFSDLIDKSYFKVYSSSWYYIKNVIWSYEQEEVFRKPFFCESFSRTQKLMMLNQDGTFESKSSSLTRLRLIKLIDWIFLTLIIRLRNRLATCVRNLSMS